MRRWSREITAPDFPPTDILIVGDHMPPYFDRHHRQPVRARPGAVAAAALEGRGLGRCSSRFLRAAQSPQAALQALLGGANRAQLARYVLISGLAFALDLTVFLQLMPLGVSPVWASVTGYLCGTQLHWLLSTRLVFAAGVRQIRPRGGASRCCSSPARR